MGIGVVAEGVKMEIGVVAEGVKMGIGVVVEGVKMGIETTEEGEVIIGLMIEEDGEIGVKTVIVVLVKIMTVLMIHRVVVTVGIEEVATREVAEETIEEVIHIEVVKEGEGGVDKEVTTEEAGTTEVVGGDEGGVDVEHISQNVLRRLDYLIICVFNRPKKCIIEIFIRLDVARQDRSV